MGFGSGQGSGVFIGASIGQPQRHGAVGTLGQRGIRPHALPADDFGGRLGHVHAHGVDAADHGQRRGLARSHQGAGADLGQADHAVQRRGDGGAVQVDLGCQQLRLGCLDRSLGGVAGGDGAVLGLFAGHAPVTQSHDPFRVAAGGIGLCLRLGLGCPGLGHRRFIRARIDAIQRIALGYLAAFLEQAFDDQAADLGAQFRLGRGDDAARQAGGQGYVLGLQGHNGNGRGRHIPARRLGKRTQGGHRCHACKNKDSCQRRHAVHTV